MKRGLIAAGVVAFAALLTSPAHSLTYNLKITGQLTQQTGPGSPTVVDVGDALTVEARVDSDRVFTWGDNGYSVAFLYGLPTSGDEYFRMSLNGFSYSGFDEYNDGYTRFVSLTDVYDQDGNNIDTQLLEFGFPAIIFQGSQIIGLAGNFAPNGAAPILRLGSFVEGSAYYEYDDQGNLLSESGTFTGSTSSQFTATGEQLYLNTYDGPSFVGEWDFQGSTVAVPEPATWALLIAGFAIAGAGLRRRRTRLAQVACS